ncbi:MAG: LysE family translocator [Thermomicrobiales bacterium]
MPTTSTLLLFALASLLLVIVPGPNVIYIVTRGIDQGRRAAVASALGVQASMLVHVGAAAAGLSAVLASSELLFNTVRFAGAGYLIWLGIRSWREPAFDLTVGTVQGTPHYRRIFQQGVTVNLLNPKVALFCLALLPQFVDPTRGSPAVQILILGSVMILVGIVSDSIYAMLSGGIGEWLKTRQKIAQHRQRFSGVVYIGLGALAALTGSQFTK